MWGLGGVRLRTSAQVLLPRSVEGHHELVRAGRTVSIPVVERGDRVRGGVEQDLGPARVVHKWRARERVLQSRVAACRGEVESAKHPLGHGRRSCSPRWRDSPCDVLALDRQAKRDEELEAVKVRFPDRTVPHELAEGAHLEDVKYRQLVG